MKGCHKVVLKGQTGVRVVQSGYEGPVAGNNNRSTNV